MSSDLELDAMKLIAETFDGLETDARSRVLSWLSQRYGAAGGKEVRGHHGDEHRTEGANHADFPALYDATDPKSESERALVGGYWHQVVQGSDGFDSYSVNSDLRNMGMPVSNITRAYDDLQGRSPVLVRQVQKSGKAKQARKKYRLTTAGIRAVEDLLAGRQVSSGNGDEK